MTKFFIIATGYNCASKVKDCYNSVMNQTYKNFELVIVDDCSTDNTWSEIDKLDCKKLKSWARMGAAHGRYQAVETFKPDHEDVILLLGLDDELYPNCLERVAQEYEKGKWMTYGNWQEPNGRKLPEGFLHFADDIHERRAYREDTYRSTAPNTMKVHLFKELTPEDFKINGKWIDTTTESELMFSCLEMCGRDRIGMIEDIIYLYKKNHPVNKRTQTYRNGLLAQIKQRPKKNLK